MTDSPARTSRRLAAKAKDSPGCKLHADFVYTKPQTKRRPAKLDDLEETSARHVREKTKNVEVPVNEPRSVAIKQKQSDYEDLIAGSSKAVPNEVDGETDGKKKEEISLGKGPQNDNKPKVGRPRLTEEEKIERIMKQELLRAQRKGVISREKKKRKEQGGMESEEEGEELFSQVSVRLSRSHVPLPELLLVLSELGMKLVAPSGDRDDYQVMGSLTQVTQFKDKVKKIVKRKSIRQQVADPTISGNSEEGDKTSEENDTNSGEPEKHQEQEKLHEKDMGPKTLSENKQAVKEQEKQQIAAKVEQQQEQQKETVAQSSGSKQKGNAPIKLPQQKQLLNKKVKTPQKLQQQPQQQQQQQQQTASEQQHQIPSQHQSKTAPKDLPSTAQKKAVTSCGFVSPSQAVSVRLIASDIKGNSLAKSITIPKTALRNLPKVTAVFEEQYGKKILSQSDIEMEDDEDKNLAIVKSNKKSSRASLKDCELKQEKSMDDSEKGKAMINTVSHVTKVKKERIAEQLAGDEEGMLRQEGQLVGIPSTSDTRAHTVQFLTRNGTEAVTLHLDKKRKIVKEEEELPGEKARKIQKEAPLEKFTKRAQTQRLAYTNPELATHQCMECEYRSSFIGVKRHYQRRHSKEVLTCDICGLNFGIRYDRRRHRSGHFNQQTKRLTAKGARLLAGYQPGANPDDYHMADLDQEKTSMEDKAKENCFRIEKIAPVEGLIVADVMDHNGVVVNAADIGNAAVVDYNDVGDQIAAQIDTGKEGVMDSSMRHPSSIKKEIEDVMTAAEEDIVDPEASAECGECGFEGMYADVLVHTQTKQQYQCDICGLQMFQSTCIDYIAHRNSHAIAAVAGEEQGTAGGEQGTAGGEQGTAGGEQSTAGEEQGTATEPLQQAEGEREEGIKEDEKMGEEEGEQGGNANQEGESQQEKMKLLRCYRCRYQASTLQELITHKAVHAHPKWMCTACKECFMFDYDAHDHNCKHDPFTIQLVCGRCLSPQDDRAALAEHYVTNHLPLSHCVPCGMMLEHNAELIRAHFLQRHGINIDVETRDGDSAADKPSGMVWCRLCSCNIEHTSINEHLKEHRKATVRFACNKCPFTTTQKNQMSRHHRERHRELHAVQCDMCDKTCKDQNSLKSHMFTVHETGESVTCSFCHRRFSTQKLLDSHVNRIHEKKKQYMCAMCGQSFHEKTRLSQHMDTHASGHEKELLKVYSCRYCAKGFRVKQHLTFHENTHTGRKPYKCQTCGVGFCSTAALNKHKKSHSDLRPFQCQYCKKAFKFRFKLTQHMVIHTKISDHKCPHCGKIFTCSSSLKTHSCKGFLHRQAMIHRQRLNISGSGLSIMSHPQAPPTIDSSHVQEQTTTEWSEQAPVVYMCGICNVTAETEADINEHVNVAHNAEDDRNVEICDIHSEEAIVDESGNLVRIQSEVNAQFEITSSGEVENPEIALDLGDQKLVIKEELGEEELEEGEFEICYISEDQREEFEQQEGLMVDESEHRENVQYFIEDPSGKGLMTCLVLERGEDGTARTVVVDGVEGGIQNVVTDGSVIVEEGGVQNVGTDESVIVEEGGVQNVGTDESVIVEEGGVQNVGTAESVIVEEGGVQNIGTAESVIVEGGGQNVGTAPSKKDKTGFRKSSPETVITEMVNENESTVIVKDTNCELQITEADTLEAASVLTGLGLEGNVS